MPDVLIEEVNPYRTRRASLLAEDGNLSCTSLRCRAPGNDLDAPWCRPCRRYGWPT